MKFETFLFNTKIEDVYQLMERRFTSKQGEWLSIIGHNGSGKSTVVRLIDGLLEPEAGEKSIYQEIC